MNEKRSFSQWVLERFKRSRLSLTIGAVLLVLISVGLLYLVFTGKTRAPAPVQAITPGKEVTSTTATTLVPRKLDGVLVPQGQESYAPRAVMVENHSAARPLSGAARANVVIEAPVEGGITRFLLLFDPTTTATEIGPVRSARPYYIDWVSAWDASGYFHVGGSPEALNKISALGSAFDNVDEIGNGQFFWRSSARLAPHNAYTSQDLMTQAVNEKGFASSTSVVAWHFQDAATTTKRGDAQTIKIPYGNSYSVSWKFDKDRDVYTRYQAGQKQADADGTLVEAENVIVMKTDVQVLDGEGRLRLRTVGSGDAVVYRDGNKYSVRWRRGADEPIRFEGTDGSEFILNRGRVWIEVTTDDRIFAGLGQ